MCNVLMSVWKWIRFNRFLVGGVTVGVILFAVGACMEPATTSVLRPEETVTASQLKLEFVEWQKKVEFEAVKFEFAQEDIAKQKEALGVVYKSISALAEGNIGGAREGLLFLVVGGGLGAIFDNIHKRGVLSGLKRNA